MGKRSHGAAWKRFPGERRTLTCSLHETKYQVDRARHDRHKLDRVRASRLAYSQLCWHALLPQTCRGGVACCGRRLARGRHRDLPALRVPAPAPLLVLVLLLVLTAASRLCSPCCASPRHDQMRSQSDSRRSARGLGWQGSRAIRWVRPTAPSPSARAPRPQTRRDCTMQNPHITLHIAKHLLLASGQLIERVWHRQTRLDETNKTCREGSPIVTAVASTRLERVPSLSACSVCCAGKLTHAHAHRPARGADARRLARGAGTSPRSATRGAPGHGRSSSCDGSGAAGCGGAPHEQSGADGSFGAWLRPWRIVLI